MIEDKVFLTMEIPKGHVVSLGNPKNDNSIG